MVPAEHKKFLEHALPKFQEDQRILGVAAAGSWLSGAMDAYSDLDLVIAVDPQHFSSVMQEAPAIANSIGRLLTTFTGEHVGEPTLFICLYEEPLLHVDLKFVALPDLAQRAEDPAILWERGHALTKFFEQNPAQARPPVDLQWIEDRFWTWIHYGALRLGRGEVFEALDMLSFLRSRVLGPLLLQQKGKPPWGVRRIEQYRADALPALRQTMSGYSPHECAHALKETAKIYLDLRETLAADNLRRHRRAEMASLRFLHEVLRPHSV